MRRKNVFGVVLAAALTGFCSCAEPSLDPDVLLVTIDTLRPDHLGAYGHPEVRTPHLDALARRGVQFQTARVPYPLTLPSHSTIFTGLLPYRHGARRNDSFDLDRAAPTIASELGGHGYETGAIVSTFVLNESFGLADGFDDYVDFPQVAQGRDAVQRRGDEVTDLAIEWLEARGNGPWFLWTHYFDPHDLYVPPFPFSEVYGHDLYAGEVSYTDQEFGRLLRTLAERGELEDLLIVITSDHGEALGEHGEVGHGYFLYETTVRVPLLFVGPGFGAQRIVRVDVARTVDVFPTLFAALEREIPSGLIGRTLQDSKRGESQYLETFEPSFVYGATELKGVVGDGWKYIEAPRPELYDLKNDPHELENLYASNEDLAGDLLDELEVHVRLDREQGRSAENEREVDDATKDRLRALGYLGGGTAAEAQTGWARRDPKDIVHLIPLMNEGMEECRAGDWADGIPKLERVLSEDPINGRALYWVSAHRLREGDLEGAIEVYRNALTLDPTNPIFFNTVGLLQIQVGQPQEAIESLRMAVELDPQMVAAHLNLARALMGAGQPRRARASIRRALEVDPGNEMALQAARAVGLETP